MSPAMTRALRKDAATDPMRKKALEKLVKDTPWNYEPRALGVVDVDFHGVGVGGKNFTGDGEKAYQAALLHWAHPDPGAAGRYAELALRILRAWAETNHIFTGNNAPLLSAWGGCAMARTAELLKHSQDEAVRRAWGALEAAWYRWLDTQIMPVLTDAKVWRWGFLNNWHTSIVCARMQIAILREDAAEWAWCVKTFPDVVNRVLVCARCPGETTDTCRDVTHGMFSLGGLLQAPEMALHQGVRLYDDRMADACELQSSIMMQEVPAGLTPEDIKTPYGFWYEPVLELGLAHFQGRKGRAMPKTSAYLQKVRPERVTFHWGAGTLTHFGRTKP